MKTYNTINVSFVTDDDCALEFANMVQALIPKDAENVEVHSNARPATYTLKICQEPVHDFNPRDDDNIGTMRCAHGRYDLGDEESDGNMFEDMLYLLSHHCDIELEDELDHIHDMCEARGEEGAYNEKAQEFVGDIFDKYFISAPLYLYDHSGITISMGPFSCPWDSGCVGFIYVTRKRAEEELGLDDGDLPTGRDFKNYESLDDYVVNHIFANEIKVYDQYLRGDVWYFVIEDAGGDVVDSCAGFFGDDWKTNGLADQISDRCKALIDDIRLLDSMGNEIDKLDHEDVFG